MDLGKKEGNGLDQILREFDNLGYEKWHSWYLKKCIYEGDLSLFHGEVLK